MVMCRLAFSLLGLLLMLVPSAAIISDASSPTSLLRGRVITLDGLPVSGAKIYAGSREVTADIDGWFRIEGDVDGEWVTADHDAFLPRVRAVVPGAPTLFRLAKDDGETIVLRFGGDVMFGRRFYDHNGDGNTSDGLLQSGAGVEDHVELLEGIRRPLENADLTVVNLETPLTTDPWIHPTESRPEKFHPTKNFVFASAPESAGALRDVGIDLFDLGNNHLYDAKEKGLADTFHSLEHAGFAPGVGYFGAG